MSGPTGAMTVILIPVIEKYGLGAVPALGVIAGVMVILMGLFKLGQYHRPTHDSTQHRLLLYDVPDYF